MEITIDSFQNDELNSFKRVVKNWGSQKKMKRLVAQNLFMNVTYACNITDNYTDSFNQYTNKLIYKNNIPHYELVIV